MLLLFSNVENITFAENDAHFIWLDSISKQNRENTEHGMDCGMVHHHHQPLPFFARSHGMGGENTIKRPLPHAHEHTHTHTHVIIHLSHFVYQCITSLVCACVSRFFFEFLNLPRTRGEYKSKQAKAQASMRTSKQGNLVAAVAAAAVENMCNDTNIAKSKTSKHHRRRRF